MDALRRRALVECDTAAEMRNFFGARSNLQPYELTHGYYMGKEDSLTYSKELAHLAHRKRVAVTELDFGFKLCNARRLRCFVTVDRCVFVATAISNAKAAEQTACAVAEHLKPKSTNSDSECASSYTLACKFCHFHHSFSNVFVGRLASSLRLHSTSE
jgi:hypothetical protein